VKSPVNGKLPEANRGSGLHSGVPGLCRCLPRHLFIPDPGMADRPSAESAGRSARGGGPLRSFPVEERILGSTGRAVSVIGQGTWQLGADWGEVDDKDALAVLDAAAAGDSSNMCLKDGLYFGHDERIPGIAA
jgi:hypothetical protein